MVLVMDHLTDRGRPRAAPQVLEITNTKELNIFVASERKINVEDRLKLQSCSKMSLFFSCSFFNGAALQT